jgi:hypothetical protein
LALDFLLLADLAALVDLRAVVLSTAFLDAARPEVVFLPVFLEVRFEALDLRALGLRAGLMGAGR